jgi:hypothetical protein
MIRIIAGLILLLVIFTYGMLDEKKQEKNPAISFHYVSIDTSSLKYKQKAYVPADIQRTMQVFLRDERRRGEYSGFSNIVHLFAKRSHC